MAKRRRTEIAKIADPAARRVTFTKRRNGLFKKASDLCYLCGARAAVVVFSPAGKPFSIGVPSADEIISDYLRGVDGDGDVVPPMGLTELVEAEWEACATEEDLESFISKYEAVQDSARGKLKALEDASQVKVSASDSHVLSEEEMDSLFESLGRCPALSDLLNDCDGDALWTSQENSAAYGGSSAVESIPAVVHDFAREKLEALENESQVKVGAGDSHILHEEEIDLLFQSSGRCPALSDLLTGGDGDAFWTSPESLAASGGISAVESIPALSNYVDCGYNATVGGSSGVASTRACSDLEGCGFDPDDFLNPSEDCDMDGDGDGFLTSQKVSVVGGENSGAEPPSNGYNPNDFAGLGDLGVL